MPQRSAGWATTSEPRPTAHSMNSRPQPTGTAQTKRIARRSPKFAASAVDRVVLGPGVKLVAADNSSRALNSAAVMGQQQGGSWWQL